MEVEITSSEGESVFNFDRWIKQNGLGSIRNLFIKHNMTTPNKLSMQSESFKHLMSDTELIVNNSQLIPIVITAMQKVTSYVVKRNEYVVVAEEEDSIMETLKKNIIQLNVIENKLNDLKQKYPQSIKRIKDIKLNQIKKAKNKINKVFDDMNVAIKTNQQTVVQQLMNIQNDINNDDSKEIDLISDSMDKITISRKYLASKLETCENMIHSSDNDINNRKKRKKDIVNIGKEANEKFSKAQNELDKNIEMVENMIEKNNNKRIKIEYQINEGKYKKILSKMGNIGVIINKEYNLSEKEEKLDIEEDEDDRSIKKLQNDIQIYKQEINDKNNANVSLKRQLLAKTNELEQLQQQLSAKRNQNQQLQLQQQFQSKTNQYKRLQQHLTDEKQQSAQLRYEMKKTKTKNEKTNRELNSLKQSLLKALSFKPNDKYRWYIEDEKANDIQICKMHDNKKDVVFMDGKNKQNISHQNIPTTPNITANNLGKLIKSLKQNAIKILDKQFQSDDKWDANLKRSSFKIEQNTITNTTSGNGTAFLSKIVSEGKHSWIFKIKKPSSGLDYLGIGIMDISHNLSEHVNTYMGSKAKTAYVCEFGYAHLNRYDNGGDFTDVNSYAVKCSDGDLVTMNVNFDSLILSYSVNGKDYGEAFKIKKGKYRAGISVNAEGTSMELLS